MKLARSALTVAALLAACLALAACNPGDPTLGTADSNQAQTAAATGPVAITPPAASDATQNAAARVHIAPIIGSTVAAVTPLSRRLAATSAANGLALVADSDPARTHVIKGYFSALAEGAGTTIVFVWDVFNPQGVRLHRIQGQEAVAGSAPDPWSIVPPTIMERIADRLVAEFRAWQSGTAVPVVPALPGAPAPAPVAAPVPAPAVAPAPTVTPSPIPVTPAPAPSISPGAPPVRQGVQPGG